MEVKTYYKDGRKQWRCYCDTCKALVGDTAPGEYHLPRSNELENICPFCGKSLTIEDNSANQAEIPVKQ